jgi:hypothetical protein
MGRKHREEIEDLDDDEGIVDQTESDEAGDGGQAVVEEEAAEEETGADETAEGEFGEAIGEDEIDEYDDTDLDLKVVDEVLSHKDQNARALAIRRAIEERLEAKRLSRDLDYLDLDTDD